MAKKKSINGFDLRRNNAIEELEKLIKRLDYVEVNVDLLFRLLSSYRRIKQENIQLKAKIDVQEKHIKNENFKRHTPNWVDIKFFLEYSKINRFNLYYAIRQNHIQHKEEKGKKQIDLVEAINYFSERRYNKKKGVNNENRRRNTKSY